MDLIDVRKELEIILDVTEENPNFINRCTPKINFNIHSTKDNLSLENHSKNHRFNSRPASYAFDNNSRKSNNLDDSTFSHGVQNPCGVEAMIILLDWSIIESLLVLRKTLWSYFWWDELNFWKMRSKLRIILLNVCWHYNQSCMTINIFPITHNK